jgi:branched-subunit amino acid transport protein
MTWLAVLAVGLGSFAFRVGPLVLFQRVSLGERGDRLVRHAGISAITALIVMATRNDATGSATVPTLLAVGVAAVLAARGASMVRLLVVGGSLYAAALALVGGLTH